MMNSTDKTSVAEDAKGQSWPYAYAVEQPSAEDAKIRLAADAAKARFRATGRVRPDLNGVAVTAVPWGSGPVFLIDRGYRRGIVSEAVFVALYGQVPNRDLVREVLDLDAIPMSEDGNLYEGAYLVQAYDVVTPVFLIDKIRGQIVKRGFPSGTVFNQFQFSWDKIEPRRWAEIEGIPGGPQIDGR